MAARTMSRRQETPELIERLFKLRANATTVSTEVIGGVTTFFVMAYIIALNPIILNYVGNADLQGKNLGPGFPQTVAMTALCAGVLTIAMGFYANRPFAMAAGRHRFVVPTLTARRNTTEATMIRFDAPSSIVDRGGLLLQERVGFPRKSIALLRVSCPPR